MNFPSSVVASTTNLNQAEGIVSLSPLSAHFKECLARMGAEATLQLLLELYQRNPIGEETGQTSGDPLEPYAREPIGTGYADEFLM